jgi:thiamine biosynthesis lipoprotein
VTGAVEAVVSRRRPGARSAFALWGGKATVLVVDPRGLDAAVAQVRRTVTAVDRCCSSFRDDSELASLNAAAGEPVVVSSLLMTAVREAVRAARETEGTVDPTVGDALIAHGVNPQLRPGTRPRIERVAGYRAVTIDEAASSILLPRGVCLDLGATAKALAADMAAAAAATAAGCGVLVSLCGDVATSADSPTDGWRIRVADDHRDERGPGQTVTITTGGLATSSVTVRRAGNGHHLIDPGTGLPADGPWRTASVAAGSCTEANMASTAAIVLGAAAPAWLAQRRAPARLVGVDATVRHLGGWPTDGDDL